MQAILGCATTTTTATNDDEVHTKVHTTTMMKDMRSNITKATHTINPTNATLNVTKVITTSTQLKLGGWWLTNILTSMDGVGGAAFCSFGVWILTLKTHCSFYHVLTSNTVLDVIFKLMITINW
jgi:hypothetical protein